MTQAVEEDISNYIIFKDSQSVKPSYMHTNIQRLIHIDQELMVFPALFCSAYDCML